MKAAATTSMAFTQANSGASGGIFTQIRPGLTRHCTALRAVGLDEIARGLMTSINTLIGVIIYFTAVVSLARVLEVFRRSPRTKRRASKKLGWLTLSDYQQPPHPAVTQRVLKAALAWVDRCCSLDSSLDHSAARGTVGHLLAACAERMPDFLRAGDSVAVITVARLASWVPKSCWVRPLAEWKATQEDPITSLCMHLLERYEAPVALRWALTYRDSPDCSDTAQRSCFALTRVYVAAGAGESLRDALRAFVSPSISRKCAAAFGELSVMDLSAAK